MRLDRLFQRRVTPELVAEQVTALPQEFAHIYEQSGQPTPEPELLKQFISGELDRRNLLAHLRNVESARGLQRTISRDELLELSRYGIRNLAHTRINAQVSARELLDMTGADLRGANLTESTFNSVNFTNAHMGGITADRTHFTQSILSSAEIPSIIIKDRVIDLESGAVTVAKDDTWNIYKSDVDPIDNCSDCEVYNQHVLDISNTEDKSKYSRRGVLLFQEGKPLGMLKLKGENSFLAMRTVRNSEGEAIFWKGMVYALEHDLNQHLKNESRRFEGNDQWRRADTESLRGQTTLGGRIFSELGRNNLRFIASPRIFDRLDELTNEIEARKEPMVDIFE